MKKEEKRVNEILEVLLSYVQKDFSRTIPVSKKGDELDAISVGLNTMAEEMQAFIAERKKHERKIKKMNVGLEKEVAERTQELLQNEKRFRALIENSNEVIIVSDLEGNRLFVSEGINRMLGYTPEEYMRLNIFNMVPAEQADSVQLILQKIVDNPHQPTTINVRVQHKNGTWRWIEAVLAGFFDVPGLNGIVINYRDVTERKESIEKLEKSEKLFRAMIEKNADMMTLALPDGKLLFVSPSLTNILGFTFEEYQSKPAFDFIHPDDVPGLMEQMIGIIDSPGKSLFRQQRLLHKDGTYRWCEGTITNMLHDANIGALVSNFRDISERKEAEYVLAASESRFRSIIEQFPYPVVTFSSDGSYVNANKAWETMWQEKRENVKGYNVRKDPQLIDSGLSRYVEKAFAGELAISHPYLYDPALIGQTGRKRWMQMTLYPLKTSSGEMLEVILVLQDVTENKEAEEKIRKLNEDLEQKVIHRTTQLESNILQLKESEEKYRTLFNSIDEGYCIIEMIFDEQKKPVDYLFLEINASFERQTGLLNAVGKRMREFAPNHEEHWFEIYGKIALTGESIRFENRAEQLQRWYDVYAFSYGEQKNLQVGILFNDISERKKAAEQLEAVNKELESFTYSVSHDLRAPLRSIDGYSKMLEEDYVKLFDEEGKRLLSVVQYNAKKMSSLIDDLLAFSRLGRETIRKTDLNMNDLVQRVLIDINGATKHNAEIKVGTLTSAKGDFTLISQVMVNLISNGIKYSSKKTKPIVEITSEKKGREIIYYVRDNGEGFDMKYAEKLFGVFQRLHKADEFEGTGVGLAIVQRIVNKHEGKVSAEAELGKGAIFSFTLPIN